MNAPRRADHADDPARGLLAAIVDWQRRYEAEVEPLSEAADQAGSHLDYDQARTRFADEAADILLGNPIPVVGRAVRFASSDHALRGAAPVSGRVVRVIDKPDDHHDADVLPVFVVEIAEGVQIEAFGDELTVVEPDED